MEKLLFTFKEEIPFTALLTNDFAGENKTVIFEVYAVLNIPDKKVPIILRVNNTDFPYIELTFEKLNKTIFNKVTKIIMQNGDMEKATQEFVKTIIAKEMLNKLKGLFQ